MWFTQKSRGTSYCFYFCVRNLCVFRIPPSYLRLPSGCPPPTVLDGFQLGRVTPSPPQLVLLSLSSSEPLLLLLSFLLSSLPKYFYLIWQTFIENSRHHRHQQYTAWGWLKQAPHHPRASWLVYTGRASHILSVVGQHRVRGEAVWGRGRKCPRNSLSTRVSVNWKGCAPKICHIPPLPSIPPYCKFYTVTSVTCNMYFLTKPLKASNLPCLL